MRETRRTNPHRESGKGAFRLLAATVILIAGAVMTGCDSLDSLLDVDLPGQVTAEDLSMPELAETLVNSAQGDFECAFRGHWMVSGIWAGEWTYNYFQIELIRYSQRSSQSAWHGQGVCTSNRDPVWLPMHQARKLGELAINQITAMPSGTVEHEDLLLATAYAYEGYATQLLGETFCGFIDGGDEVVLSREQTFVRAADRFTSAINHANAALSGGRANEAQDILNMARIGRARANLNLGDGAAVVADASAVDENYVRYATYDLTPGRRTNGFNTWFDPVHALLHEDYRPADGTLEVGELGYAWDVDGVPDPRLPVIYRGIHGRGLEWYEQALYEYRNDTDIAFASWREAQLMIAEVEGGQAAVQIINRLRDTHGLPHFSSTDEVEIRDQVREERRRELFMYGTKMGDDLRWGTYTEWDSGETPLGQAYGDETCMPVPDIEFL